MKSYDNPSGRLRHPGTRTAKHTGGFAILGLGRCAVAAVSALLIASMLFACSPYVARQVPTEPLPSFDGRILNLYWPGQANPGIQLAGISLDGNMLSSPSGRHIPP